MSPIRSRTVSRRILRAVRFSVLPLTLSHVAGPWLASADDADDSVVWSVGKTDHSAIEFAPGSQLELTYKVGKSDVSKDFSGHQDGTISWLPELSREMPYTIEFDLDEPPQGAFHLELNYLYKNAAPTHIKLIVNAKKGIFPVLPSVITKTMFGISLRTIRFFQCGDASGKTPCACWTQRVPTANFGISSV